MLGRVLGMKSLTIKAFIVCAIVFLSGCQANNVRLDVNRGSCSRYNYSYTSDLTINLGKGKSIYVPISCMKLR